MSSGPKAAGVLTAAVVALGVVAAVPAAAGAGSGQERQEARVAGPTVDLTGTWTLSVETPQGTRETTVVLRMAEDGSFSGTVSGTRGETEISEGKVTGNAFRFAVVRSFGERSFRSVYEGTIEGDEMKGTVSFGERFTAGFTGKRQKGGEGAP